MLKPPTLLLFWDINIIFYKSGLIQSHRRSVSPTPILYLVEILTSVYDIRLCLYLLAFKVPLPNNNTRVRKAHDGLSNGLNTVVEMRCFLVIWRIVIIIRVKCFSDVILMTTVSRSFGNQCWNWPTKQCK